MPEAIAKFYATKMLKGPLAKLKCSGITHPHEDLTNDSTHRSCKVYGTSEGFNSLPKLLAQLNPDIPHFHILGEESKSTQFTTTEMVKSHLSTCPPLRPLTETGQWEEWTPIQLEGLPPLLARPPCYCRPEDWKGRSEDHDDIERTLIEWAKSGEKAAPKSKLPVPPVTTFTPGQQLPPWPITAPLPSQYQQLQPKKQQDEPTTQQNQQKGEGDATVIPSVKACTRCSEDATLSCVQCDRVFCDGCYNILHAGGNWKDHVKKELPSVRCSRCDAPPDIFCADCLGGSLFCDPCNRLIHAGSSASHTRVTLQETCSHCGDEPATKDCKDCKRVLCNECDSTVHEGAWQSHRREKPPVPTKPLLNPPSQEQSLEGPAPFQEGVDIDLTHMKMGDLLSLQSKIQDLLNPSRKRSFDDMNSTEQQPTLTWAPHSPTKSATTSSPSSPTKYKYTSTLSPSSSPIPSCRYGANCKRADCRFSH
eukprot:Lithocolla_globosa_v1_NODE_186_length_5337_cov_5.779712.p2 type:complete len:477 gc:universal NODE_186_length_5337_cov_5.779712:924-2354(+)